MKIDKNFKNNDPLYAEELNLMVDAINDKAEATSVSDSFNNVSISLSNKIDTSTYNSKMLDIDSQLSSKLSKNMGTSQARKSLIVGEDGNITTGNVIQIKTLDNASTTDAAASLTSVQNALNNKANNADVGNLTSLNTTNKDSIVNALNEVNNKTKINVSQSPDQPGHVVVSIG